MDTGSDESRLTRMLEGLVDADETTGHRSRPFEAWREPSGLLHTSRRCRCVPTDAERVTVRFADLVVSERRCANCPWTRVIRTAHPQIVGAFDAACRCDNLKPSGDPRQAWYDADDLVEAAAALVADADGDPLVVEVVERAAAQIRARAAAIREQLRSPEAVAAALAAVREQVASEGYDLDDDPVLIGLVRPYAIAVAGALFHQFALRVDEDGTCVLLVPRYFAELIRMEEQRSSVPTVALRGASIEAAKTAATLWEPTGAGPLRSLRTALDTALAVLA